jgi:hypothetical protein
MSRPGSPEQVAGSVDCLVELSTIASTNYRNRTPFYVVRHYRTTPEGYGSSLTGRLRAAYR